MLAWGLMNRKYDSGSRSALIVVALALAGCPDLGPSAQGSGAENLEPLDLDYYRCNVQPVLDRSCSFLDCHGDPGVMPRPFTVFSPSKLRALGASAIGSPLSDYELCMNFNGSRALATGTAKNSLLLSKPLRPDQSGTFHVGGYPFSRESLEYACLIAWLQGETQPTGDGADGAGELLESCRFSWRGSGGDLPLCEPHPLDCAAVIQIGPGGDGGGP